MPPKSKKAVEKEKQKIVEDKTFGLKNKNKSKKVEQYIKSVQSQVANKGFDKKKEAEMAKKKEEKRLAEEAKKEMALLLNKPVVVQPKAPIGVDPKSIVCEFFRAGQCNKGRNCKYSHDLKVEKKSEKIDIYTDRRAADTMDTWDDTKLGQVVDEKRGTVNKSLKTTIICKYFIEAIEQQKYGWFWECPNGNGCIYVHALPPGFVLKKKKTEQEEEDEPTPLEEIIEEQRKKLLTHTPVTLENFLKWKEEKKQKKEAARKVAEEKRLADIKAGRTQMSGREMFVFNPDAFVDDDEAADDSAYEQEDEYADADAAPAEDSEEDEETTKTTTTTTTGDEQVDNLGVQVNESLFVGGDIDDIPDEDE